MTNETEDGHAKLSRLNALYVLIGAVVVIGGYLILAHFLGIHSAFAGILLMFYLFGMEDGKISALPKAFIGALGGLATGALLAFPGLAAAVGLVAVLIAVYCLLIGFVPLLFNQSFMLVLTVVCVPSVLLEADFSGMFAAIVLSAIYFGCIAWGIHDFQTQKTNADPAKEDQS